MSRNDPCWCGSGRKWKKCHWPLATQTDTFSALRDHYKKQFQILLKTPEQIAGIRAACRLAAEILHKLCAFTKEGVTTNSINQLALDLHQAAGAIPGPLGYGNPPYTKAICTSLNDVICHGIPDDRPLQAGDFLNIDVSPILQGYYGDCSAMVAIGEISAEKKNVMDASYDCLMQAIAILKPGVLIHEIGDVIEACAKRYGCSVVDQFVGHGTGLQFHEPPNIPHHRNSMKIPLAPGMIITIEPMINAGKKEAIIADNQWTAYTIDNKPSAQWEHTLLITPTGHEILTAP